MLEQDELKKDLIEDLQNSQDGIDNASLVAEYAREKAQRSIQAAARPESQKDFHLWNGEECVDCGVEVGNVDYPIQRAQNKLIRCLVCQNKLEKRNTYGI